MDEQTGGGTMGRYAVDSGPPAIRRKTVRGILEDTQGWSFFGGAVPVGRTAPWRRPSSRTAVAALLLEVANADGAFSARERRYIEWALCGEFGLGRAGAERLLRDADMAREAGLDVEGMADVIVPTLSDRQRRRLYQMVEQLAHVHHAPTRGQEYAVRKISNLLRVGRAER